MSTHVRKLCPPSPARLFRSPSCRGWLVTIAVTLLAALPRLWDLATPRNLLFDEQYYGPYGWTLWNLGYEADLPHNTLVKVFETGGRLPPDQVMGAQTALSLHPPLGKWIIGLGEQLVGFTALGWRLPVAVLSIATVAVMVRAMLRLTGSLAVAGLTGFFLAVDTLSIGMGRIAMLDGILTFFLAAAFWALVGWLRSSGHPRRGWWLVTLGMLCGAAFAVKWSAMWFIGAFVLVMLGQWWLSRRRAQVGEASGREIPGEGVTVRHSESEEGVAAGSAETGGGEVAVDSGRRWAVVRRVVQLGAPLLVVYVSSFAAWFASSKGMAREDAGIGVTVPAFMRPAWNWLWMQVYTLDVSASLTSPGHNTSKPQTWWFPAHPVWTEQLSLGVDTPTPGCVQGYCWGHVLLGSPFLWWLGAAAVVALVWAAVRRADRVAAVVVLLVAAGWVPWFLTYDRVMYQYYMVAVAPFVAAALSVVVVRVARRVSAKLPRKSFRVAVTSMLLLLVALWVVWLWPVMTSATLTETQMHRHLWNISAWYPQVYQPDTGHEAVRWPPWSDRRPTIPAIESR